MSYNVTFRYTKKTEGYHGVMFWSSFPSKEDFDRFFTDNIRQNQEIVEEGVSDKRCIELTNSTPLACRIAAALQEATGLNGKVNGNILKLKLANVFLS